MMTSWLPVSYRMQESQITQIKEKNQHSTALISVSILLILNIQMASQRKDF